MKNRLFGIIGLLLALAMATSVAGQEELLLRITRIDASEFPTIHVNLVTADAQGAPLSDLSALSLRENGIPIGDLAFSSVPVGIKVIFVIDANVTLNEIDAGSELTRGEKVRDSIIRYARQFMSAQDQVSIVIPGEDGGSGRFLIENGTTPDLVIAAIEAYTPEGLNRTPLNEMLTLALAHAADSQDEGRYQAVLLFSDGAQIAQQLNFANLVDQAQKIDLPIFAAILGARADANEINNVARLYEPTQANYVHLPDVSGSDPVYSIWDRQRNQVQISYQSLQNKSGRYPVAINVGESRALAEFDLIIAPPAVTIALESSTIRRIGGAADSPLASLAPNRYVVPVTLSWPDGISRELAAMTLLLDGQPRAAPNSLNPGPEGMLQIELDMSDLDEGSYELVVQVTDVWGLSALSPVQPLTIEIERPLPPTPTAVPTSTPAALENPEAPPPATRNSTPGLLLLAAAGLVAGLALFRRRRRRAASNQDAVAVEEVESEPGISVPEEGGAYVAFLELLQESDSTITHIRIEGDNVTIGRDHLAAKIVLSHPSVAKLHARIRKREGQYWLYDEGSSNGTFHNYQQVGLVPQPLSDQDTIHFGHIGVRFHLKELDD